MAEKTLTLGVKDGEHGEVYRVLHEGREYSLVRSKLRPERLIPHDESGDPSKIAGFKSFTEEGENLRGHVA